MAKMSFKSLFFCFLSSILISLQLVATATSTGTLEQKGEVYSASLCHSHRRPHRRPPCEASPTPGGGGGSSGSTQPSPSHGGGGGYYSGSPPSPSSGGGGSETPIPIINTPPFTPAISTPPSPLIPDPNTPPYVPGTCTYWSTHPSLIWTIFGYWGTIGSLFGLPATSLGIFGGNLGLQEALENTRRDGAGSLLREGSASLLNSIVDKTFVFSTQEVKSGFAAAMSSDKAAGEQAELFKKANEGRLKKP